MVMKTKEKPYEKFLWCFLAGLCLTGISVLLFVILGKRSVFVHHDQMDGEVLCYMYHAKYLWKGSVIPEFLNGATKTTLTPPAPFFVLIYKVLPPFAAFVASWYLVMLGGYTGMALLLRRLGVRSWMACLSGVLFAYLPLLPVYGFSMYGVPLISWAFLGLLKGQESKRAGYKGQIGRLILLAFLAAASSLVLSGFAVLAAALLVGIFRKDARKSFFYWGGFLVMLLSWGLCNRSLFAQILGLGSGYVTHKEEIGLAAAPFLTRFLEVFLNGMEHARAFQKWIVILALCILAAGFVKKSWRDANWRLLGGLTGLAAVIALLCAVYVWEPVVGIRRQLGGAAVWFQMDRIYWLLPALWYAALGLCLQWLAKRNKWFLGAGLAVSLMTAVMILNAGVWKDNVKVLLNKRPAGISWQNFYAEELYGQIEDYLFETTGQRPQDYRVASLGICPAAALYNGFYCLDGYSNNYPLEYKRLFRQIIKPELDKSEYLTEYFDEWGNRCYLFSSEIPGYYTVEKGGFYFSDFEMDTEAFARLGGTYVFSAAYIENEEETGLVLLREEPFVTEESYYQIYVYGLAR